MATILLYNIISLDTVYLPIIWQVVIRLLLQARQEIAMVRLTLQKWVLLRLLLQVVHVAVLLLDARLPYLKLTLKRILHATEGLAHRIQRLLLRCLTLARCATLPLLLLQLIPLLSALAQAVLRPTPLLTLW